MHVTSGVQGLKSRVGRLGPWKLYGFRCSFMLSDPYFEASLYKRYEEKMKNLNAKADICFNLYQFEIFAIKAAEKQRKS